MSNKPQPVMGSVKQFWLIETNRPVESMRHAFICESHANIHVNHWGPPQAVQHVLEAQPTLQLIDKLEEALEFYSGLADEVFDVQIYTINREDGKTIIDRGEKAEELLTELRKWKDGLK